MTDKLASEIFEDAAQELRDHGKCTGEIMSADGRVCLMGAVGLAAEVEINHRTTTDSVVERLPSDVIDGLNAIAEKYVPDQIASFDRHFIEFPPDPDFDLRQYRGAQATRFNDGCISSSNPDRYREPATETEIIDALMEQAKFFRNEGK